MSTIKSLSDNKISERILKIRKLNKLNQKKFAESIGIKQNTLSDIERNVYPPNNSQLELIAIRYNINKKWLLTGDGQIEAGLPQDHQAVPAAKQDGKHQDYIAKTTRIITSKTIYKSALERNIDAFFQAVETEEEMQGVKQEMAEMRRDYTERLERMEQLILSLGGSVQKREASASS